MKPTFIIDADDTLWENNVYYERCIAAFAELMVAQGLCVTTRPTADQPASGPYVVQPSPSQAVTLSPSAEITHVRPASSKPSRRSPNRG